MTVTLIMMTMMITPVMGIKTHSERTLEASFLPPTAGDAGTATTGRRLRGEAPERCRRDRPGQHDSRGQQRASRRAGRRDPAEHNSSYPFSYP